MSSVPAEIAGIGSTAQKLRPTPGFDALKSGLGPEEYFLLSRIDGAQTIRDILLATGLPVDRGIAIVTRLRSVGALLLPGETQPPAPNLRIAPPPRTTTTTRPPTSPAVSSGRAPTSQPVPRAATAPIAGPTPRPATSPVAPRPPTAPFVATASLPAFDLANPTSEELTALAEDINLDVAERRRVLALRRLVDKQDPHMMLGVSQGADAKQLKRAYFLLSKEIHPDRFYGKELGSFRVKMGIVFEAVSKAYAVLTSGDHPSSQSGAHKALQQQTPQEYAAEVFNRACQLEVGGDALGAMKLFAAAVRVNPQTRYLRRAAICALAANQPKTAVEYAKKAQTQSPSDPSSARLLATTFRAIGKLADAEDVLVMAMAMKSENDALMNELRHDLADVRRMLAASEAR